MGSTLKPTASAKLTAPPFVLITGAGRGIGAATARICAARGWDVAVNCARDAARLQRRFAILDVSGAR
jgi:NAD(P)-dependent dehydrogenase (short-subunit alcohol dehydrogenase family)